MNVGDKVVCEKDYNSYFHRDKVYEITEVNSISIYIKVGSVGPMFDMMRKEPNSHITNIMYEIY